MVRDQNADALAELYANGDGPTNFFLKRKEWGGPTITCQGCHQTQAKVPDE